MDILYKRVIGIGKYKLSRNVIVNYILSKITKPLLCFLLDRIYSIFSTSPTEAEAFGFSTTTSWSLGSASSFEKFCYHAVLWNTECPVYTVQKEAFTKPGWFLILNRTYWSLFSSLSGFFGGPRIWILKFKSEPDNLRTQIQIQQH